MRILIVDKLASYRRRLRNWLEEGGHSAENILEAQSGNSAMELLRREDFNVDAIICEWEQTTVGAMDFLKQLRAVPGFTSIGFIAVGPGQPDIERGARAAGTTTYIAQPIDPEALLQTLVNIEKAAIEARRRTASPTTRWRILANDRPARPATLHQSPTDAGHVTAESELRKGAKTVYLKPGEELRIAPAGPLYWIETGKVTVLETRGDRAVLEYALGPGQFLNEAPFGGFGVASIVAKATEETWLSSRESGAVDQLRRANPVLFYSFRNTANERLRKYQKSTAQVSTAERGLAGEIDSLPVGDLVGILNGARKTGVLRIEAAGRASYLQFAQGTLCHAESEGQVGEEVFYSCLLLSKGRFEFMPGPLVDGPVTIALDIQSLLLEGLKRRDEYNSRAPQVRK